MAGSARSRSGQGKENRQKHGSRESAAPAPASHIIQPWAPSAYTAFKAILSARLCAAIWSNISDCDETFNYWEPMHYLMHGTGFQTWEYSPAYAIRSYAYVWLHIVPLQLYTAILQANKILQFYFLKCILCFICSLCEVYFYRAVCRHLGVNTGRLTLCFLLFSSGMFISCAAFLPSSFAMYLTMTAFGGWWMGHYPVAILSVAASALLGWPFAGALGVPIAWDLLIRRRKIGMFIMWCIIALVLIMGPMIQVDSHHYGGLVIAPLNIVLYNVFSSHGANLYGVEPWSFYFMNGFLNFNIIFPLALVSLPLAYIIKFFIKQTSDFPLWLSLGAMYIWVGIFFPMAHKEERFLFPIYPLVALAGAVAIDHCQKFWSYLMCGRSKASHYTQSSNWMGALTIAIFAVLSISRGFALFYGYHAPLDIYGKLTEVSNDPKIHTLPPDKNVNVCVGKEWYRFPSSFFMPNDKWHLQFIKSDFSGQLPKPYGQGKDATRKVPSHMNDLNIEEPSRYINISKCHYLIDLDVPRESNYEPRYSEMTSEWKVLESAPFLDAERSNKLLRSFYIPFLTEKYCSYINYNLLKTTRTKRLPTKNS